MSQREREIRGAKKTKEQGIGVGSSEPRLQPIEEKGENQLNFILVRLLLVPPT